MEEKRKKMTSQRSKSDLYLVIYILCILAVSITIAIVFAVYIKLQSYTNDSSQTAATTDQTQANSNNTNVTTAEAYYCAGISSYTNWQLYSTSGITMNIDTSNCSFPSTPSYFVSISGTSSHWLLAGYTAIYFPTNISFTIYARPLIVWSNTYMLNNAQTCLWNINWFGISYST
ncbi:unnamed protein product [Rotaria socialis]|uniref:Uncharacterized protein n=1 Tax=Rotaria socialis TaxID=392032 RepID=A0A818W5V5_9BILA|nr:unnamed protein product [Rotaria socialis]